MEPLEEHLEEVKGLYRRTFGHSVDVDNVEQDGITWEVTRGKPPSMDSLEERLREVKGLYGRAFGHSTDVNVDIVEQDGIMWEVTRGNLPAWRRSRRTWRK